MRKAFSLIEMIITIALSSILFGALMSFLYVIQKSADKYYNFVADDLAVNISNYLFRDFSGAFVLPYDPNDKNFQNNSKQQLIKDCFECTTDADGLLKEIKFITNNYLPIYNGNKSRINRVIYKLEKNDDLYQLKRSKDLDILDLESNIFYTVLDQIKECKVKLYQIIETDNGEKETKILTSWSANRIFQENDKKSKTLALLPQQIVFTITLQSEKTFEFLIPIFGYFIDFNDQDVNLQEKKQKKPLDNQSSQEQSYPMAEETKLQLPPAKNVDGQNSPSSTINNQVKGLSNDQQA
jgi:prepilin-type N-terminal cleavage/methylation domain-containing protein